MVEFYIDIRVVLILVFAHGPPTLLAQKGQGIKFTCEASFAIIQVGSLLPCAQNSSRLLVNFWSSMQ